MSRLLVDTHVLLWWLADDAALSSDARELLKDPNNELLVSAASLWEIAIKRALGKLSAPEDLPELISAQGFGWLPVTSAHAWKVSDLPAHHRDPFDRLLIAQATVEQLEIITADRRFKAFDVGVRW